MSANEPPAAGPGFRVRPASIADATTIAEHRVRLFRTVLPEARWAEAEAMREPSRAALSERLAAADTLAWLAEVDGAGGAVTAAGSLVMHLVKRLPSPRSTTGLEGYIVHVYVDEAHRDSGLGARLLAAAEEESRRRGFSRIRLHSTDRAVPFYRRAGYAPRTNDFERMLP